MFGMSVFQSVLERLKTEEDEDIADEPASAAVRGLNAGFVGNLASAGVAHSGAVQRAYFDTAGEDMLAPAKPIPKPVMPDHLYRVRPEEIAEDLALTETETPQTLAEKRRHFAAGNHPDRHHPDFRAGATIRMKVANMLIDEALARLKILNRN